MSKQELRDLAESYIEQQLKQANANVTDQKRSELVEAAMQQLDPKSDYTTAS